VDGAISPGGSLRQENGLPAYDLSRLSVLVVDDNRPMASLVRQMLVGFGLSARNCRIATDGASGFMALRAFPADLVVCNWQMAPLDGLDFLRLVRRACDSPRIDIPVIVLSAFTEKSHVERARDMGANEYLAKPVSPSRLYARIVALIDRPRAFVECAAYVGPERRRLPSPERRRAGGRPYEGPERRDAGGLARAERRIESAEYERRGDPSSSRGAGSAALPAGEISMRPSIRGDAA